MVVRAYSLRPAVSEADVDQSGCIDHAEFRSLLRQLGRNIGPDVARHCIVRCVMFCLAFVLFRLALSLGLLPAFVVQTGL